MKSALFIIIFSFLISANIAHAYIPPSYYIYERIFTKTATKHHTLLLTFKVFQRSSVGMEVPLGDIQVATPIDYSNGWPAITLLFPSSAESLKDSIEKFGIPVKKEIELVRLSKEAAAESKTPVRPFYNRDENVRMRRLRNAFAYVHTDAMAPQKSIWVDKFSFNPLKIEAPCPPEVDKIPGIKSGPGICELEFHNLGGAAQSRLNSSKLLFLKDGNTVLVLSLEKVQALKEGHAQIKPPTIAEETLPLVRLLLN